VKKVSFVIVHVLFQTLCDYVNIFQLQFSNVLRPLHAILI